MGMRWMRVGIVFALIMMTACGALAQAAVVDNGSDPASKLNMRTGPSKDAGSIGKFLSGTRVQIVADAGNGWSQVRIGGGANAIDGYMMNDYLKESAAVNATQTRQVVSPYGTPSVVLRDRASNSYDAVAMLQVGETVTQIGTSGDFCYVMTAGQAVGCLLGSELR